MAKMKDVFVTRENVIQFPSDRVKKSDYEGPPASVTDIDDDPNRPQYESRKDIIDAAVGAAIAIGTPAGPISSLKNTLSSYALGRMKQHFRSKIATLRAGELVLYTVGGPGQAIVWNVPAITNFVVPLQLIERVEGPGK